MVYVKDASRVTHVVSQLLNPDRRDGFLADLQKDYQKLRDDYAKGSRAPALLSIAKARDNAFDGQWFEAKPIAPKQCGVFSLDDFPLSQLVNYIDWTPFFRSWQCRGPIRKF